MRESGEYVLTEEGRRDNVCDCVSEDGIPIMVFGETEENPREFGEGGEYFREYMRQMRTNYWKKPLKDIHLKYLTWLGFQDDLMATYGEKEPLVQRGEICFACAVQANSLLYKSRPYPALPANLIFSREDRINNNPEILVYVAHRLFSYKNKSHEEVPEMWQPIADTLTGERGRENYTFYVKWGSSPPMKVWFNSNLIFRKYLPKRRLCSTVFPVLALPGECATVVILPETYWPSAFRADWIRDDLFHSFQGL